jgi:hypothetical protein
VLLEVTMLHAIARLGCHKSYRSSVTPSDRCCVHVCGFVVGVRGITAECLYCFLYIELETME